MVAFVLVVWKVRDPSVLGEETLIPGHQDKTLGELLKDMMQGLILTVCFSFSQRIQSAVIFGGISG